MSRKLRHMGYVCGQETRSIYMAGEVRVEALNISFKQ